MSKQLKPEDCRLRKTSHEVCVGDRQQPLVIPVYESGAPVLLTGVGRERADGSQMFGRWSRAQRGRVKVELLAPVTAVSMSGDGAERIVPGLFADFRLEMN